MITIINIDVTIRKLI